MADTTPISPPTDSAKATTTFPHTTSSAVATQTPFIDTNTPAINAVAVELDGIPTSPTTAAAGQQSGETTSAAGTNVNTRNRKGSAGVSPGLDSEREIEREFLGEGGVEESAQVKQKRADLLASRSKDPGVITDVPQFPTAEEVEAAKSADGVSTPKLGA